MIKLKKVDLRVIKTKQNLYEGLLLLLKDNSFENIRVLDICNKANINRSTFYDHFSDKYELLNSLFNDIQNDFNNNIVKIEKFNNIKDYYLEVVKRLLNHFNSNIEVYSSIIKNNNHSISFDMLKEIISKDFEGSIDKFRNVYDDIPDKIIISYYVPAVISVCLEYLYNPNLYSEDDIVNYLDKLIVI